MTRSKRWIPNTASTTAALQQGDDIFNTAKNTVSVSELSQHSLAARQRHKQYGQNVRGAVLDLTH